MPPKGWRKDDVEDRIVPKFDVRPEWDAPANAALMADNTAAIDAGAELASLRAEMAKELAEVQALKAKLEIQTAVRSEVSAALQLQQQETRNREFGKRLPPEPYKMPAKPDEKLVDMKIERNYGPRGYFEVVGYQKEAVVKKLPDGRTVEVEPAEFIKGEIKPPPYAGVVFNKPKLWAGTVARFPETEAKEMRKNGIANVELAD